MKTKVFIVLIALLIISPSCSGSVLFDTYSQDSADSDQEIKKGRRASNTFINWRQDDPCLDDILAGVPPGLQRCGNQPSQRYEAGTLIIVRCPYGCKTRELGCDIKGKILIDTGEKIYHLPGQKSYKDSVIRPQYGERWFCAQLDAIASGWKKAEN